jgi:hypothetical protein
VPECLRTDVYLSGVQISLPFTGLNNPRQIAVDTSGSLYIADSSGGLNRSMQHHLM